MLSDETAGDARFGDDRQAGSVRKLKRHFAQGMGHGAKRFN
jgi:hypothetical protein